MQKVWHRGHDGWWYVTLPENGRQRQFKLHKGPATAVERVKAEHQLVQLLANRPEAGPVGRDPAWLTVSDVVNGFLAFSARTHTPETKDWYQFLLGDFKKTYGPLRVHALKKGHCLAYAAGRYKNPTSQNKVIAVVKRVFSWALEQEYIIRHFRELATSY